MTVIEFAADAVHNQLPLLPEAVLVKLSTTTYVPDAVGSAKEPVSVREEPAADAAEMESDVTPVALAFAANAALVAFFVQNDIIFVSVPPEGNTNPGNVGLDPLELAD